MGYKMFKKHTTQTKYFKLELFSKNTKVIIKLILTNGFEICCTIWNRNLTYFKQDFRIYLFMIIDPLEKKTTQLRRNSAFYLINDIFCLVTHSCDTFSWTHSEH